MNTLAPQPIVPSSVRTLRRGAQLTAAFVTILCAFHAAQAQTVTNVNDSGAGSLRQAILDSNSMPGVQTIAFQIPGAGVQTITPTSALPVITDPVVIDGYTQPGASANTLAIGNNAVLLIELSGNGLAASGLNISAGNSTVRGLVINRFGGGGTYGVRLNSSNNTVEGCFIGTDPTGTVARVNSAGVGIVSGSANTIGGTSAAARNLISGNNSFGVEFNGSPISGNFVQGNYVGTNAAGTGALPNTTGIGLSGSNNTIGGTAAGAGNLISGNTTNGIFAATSSNTSNLVQGNVIGLAANGTTALPNQNGISLGNSGGTNTIGGTTAAARNVISGNSGSGIFLTGGSGNVVQGNYIGVAADGTTARGNGGSGIFIDNLANNNTIGGAAAGAGNVIANNGADGIGVFSGTGNAVQQNSIFANGATTLTLGIDLGANGVTPNDAGDPDTGGNNLQNFPVLTSVTTNGGNTTIQGTLNSTPGTQFTVEFFANNTCDASGNGEGQTFLGSSSVTTDTTGNATINATLSGTVANSNLVTATATDPNGNTSEFSACRAVTLTTITVTNTNDSGAGSLRQAIIDANASSGTQTIAFNIPGSGVQTIIPVSALPAVTDPVVIDGYTQPGSSVNTLAQGTNAVLLIELSGPGGGGRGLEIRGGNSVVRGLVINRFNNAAAIDLNTGSGNRVEGCFLGTDAGGTAKFTDQSREGIGINNSTGNTVGGTTPDKRNLISGHRLTGVSIFGTGVGNNVVQGNLIGVDKTGLVALGNGQAGVAITGFTGNTVGGNVAAAGNVISANVTGITMFSGSNLVQGNYIGTDVTGTLALGNSGIGIFMQGAASNLVGGLSARPGQAPGNIISGNGSSGIDINGNVAPGNIIQGNLIGVNAAGTAALANTGGGITLRNTGGGNLVGDTNAQGRNVISGNGQHGVSLDNNDNRVINNYIGVGSDGSTAVGNGRNGVLINSRDNNALTTNVIAFNGEDGIAINFFNTGTGNVLQSNSIFANTGLGIDLGNNGVTPNDAGDADAGANNLQNFPVLTAAMSFAGSTNVQGTLNSTASTQFSVEFFSNPTCDSSGNGEGQTFLGSTQVTTDANGNATINATLASSTTVGQAVTATATDPNGNTSEFSACRAVSAPAQTFTISGRVVDAVPTGIAGALVTLSGSAAATTTTDNTGSYSFRNLAPGGNYTVTATSANYSFSPPSQTFNNLTTNRTANFIGTLTVVSIGGRVTDAQGNGLGGVSVNLSGSQTGTTTTDAAGNYSFGGLAAGGNYIVTPTGGAYSPAGQQFNNLRANAAANFTLVSSLACTPPPTGMVAWYPGDGSANDILGGNNGTLQNGAAFATGEVGQAFSFDGVDDRVQVPNSPRLDITGNQLTIDAWVRPSGGGQRQVVSKAAGEPSSQRKYGMYVSLNNSLGFELRTTAGTIDLEGGSVPNDTFTHVAVTYDGSFMNWYVNGQPVRTQAQTGNIVPTSTDLIVGQFATDGLSTFNGLLDEVEIFDRALSQTEIQAIFNAGSAGKCKLSAPSAAISGRVTNGLAGLAGVTVTLSGAVSGTAQTDASGNYAFTNLTAGGNYTVTAQSPAFTFAPSRADFAALSGSVVANFSAVPVAVPVPTPPLTDNFDSNQRDAQKWSIGTLTQPVGAFDPQVTVVQQNGQLVVTPRAGLTGRHYNGYVSVNSFDFTNAQVSVEVAQAAGGGAETVFGIGSDNQNYFRFVAGPSNSPGLAQFAPAALAQIGINDVTQVLVFQVRVAGVVTQEVIPYDPAAHRFWRFRHDPPPNAIVFETSPDNQTFTERYRKTLDKSVSALAVELSAGTAAPAAGGSPAVFDNLALVASTAQFAAANFTVAEDAARATITVTRSGSVSSSPATLTYATVDNPAAVRCDNTTTLPGVAFARCDYATTIDTLTFAAGETQKTFSVPIIDDAQVEGDETFALVLRDATGASLGAPARITVTITDNDQPGQPNPVFSSPFFIRQQYLDFLSREPDAPGFNAYLNLLNNCPDVNNLDPNSPSAACDRITVSAAFFGSPEFRLKGFYVFTFYQVAFNGRLPAYAEIVSDMRAVTGRTGAETFQKRAAFATAFTQRADFKAAYDTKTDAEYVAALLARYNLTQITTPDPANPEGTQTVTLSAAQLTSQLTTGALTRAQVLRAIVQSTEVSNAEFNRAFVGMQYYGYLRRTPDTPGYNAWLNYLTAHPDDFRTMVNGFMNSQEYRLRFGANQ